MRRLGSPLVWGGVILSAIVAVALLAPLLAPFGPAELAGPSLQGPSARHRLGTNDIGQDVFSQLVWGSRTSLTVALPAAAVAVAVAVAVGVTAGLRGGLVDLAVARALDVLLAMPALPLLVLVAALVGPSRLTLLLLIGLMGWPGVARTLRSQTLSLRQRGFVAAAHGFGGGSWHLVRRHLVPALAPLLAAASLQLTAVGVFLESGLAFLGLSDPSTVSWGQVLRRAVNSPGLFETAQWAWWVVPSGLAVTLALLGLTLVAIGLEPWMNPRWQRPG